jgi:hypothetical protein
MEKLARPMVNLSTLHIIILTSIAGIENAKNWQDWLAKVKSWSRPTALTSSIALPPDGAMMIRGWVDCQSKNAD